MRHLLTLADVTAAEIERIFSITEDLKQKCEKGLRVPLLPGRVMAMIFEKPSLRTRVSFEAGMTHLGGSSVFLGNDTGFGSRESFSDFARVLGEYADVVVVRANRHQTALELAKHGACSVMNGLTDFGHPCQALADLYTIRELVGKVEGHTLAWIGDANNVARSWPSVAANWPAAGDGHAQKVSVRRKIAGLDQAASAESRFLRHDRSGRSGRGAPWRSTPTFGEQGPGGAAGTPPPRVRPLSGECRFNGPRPTGPSSCTACPLIAARK